MNNDILRNNLMELLKGGSAHLTMKDALKDLAQENRAKRPSNNVHSVWELLVHIKTAQEDIYQYTIDPFWKSPKWPDEYWPPKDQVDIPDELWNETIKNYKSDLNGLIKLVENKDLNLLSDIPHGEGRTYLREILLAADHNSHHIGQIVVVRKMLGDWK